LKRHHFLKKPKETSITIFVMTIFGNDARRFIERDVK